MSAQRVETYVNNQLSHNGFVIHDWDIAYQINPGAWPSPQEARVSFTQYTQYFARVKDYPNILELTVKINGSPVPVSTRSTLDLAERIEYLTGMNVSIEG